MTTELTPLERAVTTALSQNPSVSADVRTEANNYCNAFKESSGSWQHCCSQFILRSRFPESLLAWKLDTPTKANEWLVEPRFWYLQVILEQIPFLSSLSDIKHLLFVYVNDILPWRCAMFASIHFPESYTHDIKSPSCISFIDNPAILTKIALLFVRSLVKDYPEDWSDGVQWLVEAVRQRRALAGDLFSHETSNPHNQLVINRESFAAKQQYIAVLHLFLSIWDVFFDEVIFDAIKRNNKEKHANMKIKDALREGDIVLVSNVWLWVLDDFKHVADVSLPHHQFLIQEQLVSKCLRVIGKFVSWIDVHMIANNAFLASVFKFFNMHSGCGPACMELIGAIFCKRMDAGQRIVMTHHLKLLDHIIMRSNMIDFGTSSPSVNDSATYMSNIDCNPPDDYIEKLSELINLVGIQLLDSFKELRKEYSIVSSNSITVEDDYRVIGGVQSIGPNPYFTPITNPHIWGEMQQEAWNMLQQLLPKLTLVLSYPHPHLAILVEPFFSEFLRELKYLIINDEGQLFKPSKYVFTDPLCPLYIPIQTLRPFLLSLFKLTLERIQYPYWFDLTITETNENQDDFILVRKTITGLFKRLYAVDDHTSLQFLKDIVDHLITILSRSPSSIHIHQCEAVLYLLCLTSECYKDIGKTMTGYDHPLAHCLRSIFSCHELLHHPSIHIRILLFQMTSNFLQFLQNRSLHPPHTNYIESLLYVLLSTDGILCSESSNSQTLHLSQHVNNYQDPNHELIRQATVSLLRFVKSHTNVLVRYTSQILNALQQAGMFNVLYIPSNQWRPLLQHHSSDNCNEQHHNKQSTTHPLNIPIKHPTVPWTFDDQNRCLETVGILLNSTGINIPGAPSSEDSAVYVRRVLEPFLSPFLKGSEDKLNFKQLGQVDPAGVIDWVTRLLYAIAHFSKRFTSRSELSPDWGRCIDSIHIALDNFGIDSRIRPAVILLTRRMIILLKKDFIPCVITIISRLFDLTFLAFMTSTSTIDYISTIKNSTASNSQRHSLERLSLIKNMKQYQFFKPYDIPMFTGYQEVSQLLLFLNFVMVTFKGNDNGRDILLSMIPNNYRALEQNGQHEGQSHNESQPLLSRIFTQSVDYWSLMPDDSVELQREKNEIHRDIFQTINTIATNCPSVLLSLFEEAAMGRTYENQISILEWMVSGGHPSLLSSLGAAIACLQAWTTFLVFILTSSMFKDAAAQNHFNIETLLFDKLKLSVLLHQATQLSFLLDMDDPQHNKALQEFCVLLRVFTGTLPSGTETDLGGSQTLLQLPELVERLRRLFLEALPSQVCSPQDATLVLQAISLAPTAKEAKDTLKKWIVTQQMSVRPAEG